jgi:prepilin-type N-terminal cleavage/methylation domain-containing protein
MIYLQEKWRIMTKFQAPSRKAKGFTLIELIMTIVVVGIAAIPLSLLLGKHTQSVFQSADYTMALNLARLEMEKANNLAYTNINSASFSNYGGYDYDVTRAVGYAQGSALTPQSLKQVTVSVTRHGSPTVLFSLVTYIANNVSYGL